MDKRITLTFLLAMFLLISCGKRSGKPNSGNIPQTVPVIVETVQSRDIQEFIKIVGTLEGITDITLTSETNGKIVEINKKLGDWVNAGESIGSIDNEEYKNNAAQAEANLLAAEASYETAELNLNTSRKLYEEENISKNEYLQSKASFKSAKAQLEGAKASLRMAKKSLENSMFTAPVSGYIASHNLEVGEMITTGQPICTIVDSKKLIIKTGVGESDITKIEKGKCVQLTVQNLNRQCEGEITGVGIKPAAQTANYPIEIELNNPKNELYPGMVVKGYILSKTYKDVVFTSMNNVKERYDDRYIFVIDENNIARERKVKLGAKIKNNVIIKQGLKPGDLLVIEGINNLEDGTKVDIKDKI